MIKLLRKKILAEHLNRLDKNDALEFDKAFKQFCKTGVWTMTDKKENVVSGPLGTLEEMDAMGMETHGIMADPGRIGRFPGSRDWDIEGSIDCLRKTCVANNDKTHKCVMPSLCSIDEKGRCKGFKPRKKKSDKQIWKDIL